jgi:hypothetical protein
MENEQEAVKQEEESATSETVVNPVENETQVASAEQQENVQQVPTQGQAPIESVDEFGIPYKNRYMETQRKLQETVDRLPQL